MNGVKNICKEIHIIATLFIRGRSRGNKINFDWPHTIFLRFLVHFRYLISEKAHFLYLLIHTGLKSFCYRTIYSLLNLKHKHDKEC